MRILLKTPVSSDMKTVFSQFDNRLLKALTPPLISLNFIKVDEPDHIGAVIHMEVRLFGIFKQVWYNEITERELQPDQCWFVDEGIQLPKVLKKWKHKHLIIREGDQAIIVDDVWYEGRFKLLGILMYPFLWTQFAYRKPVYRRIFGRRQK